jgi:hypothetical protein
MKTLEQKKNEKFEAFRKIVKCIDSCKIEDHINSCYNLIGNYNILFKKDFPEYSRHEADVLTEVLHNKLRDLDKN